MVWLRDTVGLAPDQAAQYAQVFLESELRTIDEVTALSLDELKDELKIPLGIRKKLQPFIQ